MKTFLCCVLSLYFTYAQACSDVAAQKCFEDMGRALGLNQNNQQFNSDLFGLVNPSTANNQGKTCSALKGYDYTPVKTCITTAGCRDTSILTVEVQGMPKITYITIIEMLEGLCEPGCENMESKNTEVQQCTNKLQGGNDPCKSMEKGFACFRDIIGKCEVLVKFTESVLKTSGVFDMAKQQCPDLNVELTSTSMVLTTMASKDLNIELTSAAVTMTVSKVTMLAFAFIAVFFTWN